MCAKHCKSTITNMAVQNFEVMSDKYNVHQTCIEVIHCSQKSNTTTATATTTTKTATFITARY